MNDIILAVEDLTMSSREIAELTGKRHDNVLRDIRRQINEIGAELKSEVAKYKDAQGKPRDEYLLTKRDTLILISGYNIELRARIIDRWQELENKSLKLAVEWNKAREEGKLARRVETDVIKMFVEYATNQGSKNANFYYANITKGTYRALFIIEKGSNIKGVRDILSTFQLNQLNTAEIIVQKAIAEHMEIGTHYKDIYKIAVSRVEELAHLLGKQLPGQDNVLQLR